jgi:hypothetical protein
MQLFMKLFFTALLFCVSLSALAYFLFYKPNFNKHTVSKNFTKPKPKKSNDVILRQQNAAARLLTYAKANNLNTRYCFLVDMKIHSGSNRFFVYNLLKDSVEMEGLVTHGSGTQSTSDVQFSNVEGSLCTSLGKYKIGASYNGKFGLAYKLYGLDATNNNAFSRFVVLHSHECVPEEETTPFTICESWGCPIVATNFLTALAKYIDKADKQIMLSIYN